MTSVAYLYEKEYNREEFLSEFRDTLYEYLASGYLLSDLPTLPFSVSFIRRGAHEVCFFSEDRIYRSVLGCKLKGYFPDNSNLLIR